MVGCFLRALNPKVLRLPQSQGRYIFKGSKSRVGVVIIIVIIDYYSYFKGPELCMALGEIGDTKDGKLRSVFFFKKP